MVLFSWVYFWLPGFKKDCGAFTGPQSAALLLSSAIFTGAARLRFFLFWLGLVLGGQKKLRKDCPLKNAFFQFSKSPILLRGEKKLLFFEVGAIFCLKKNALQCLLIFAPVRGGLPFNWRLWKSLFGARFWKLLFCESQPFTRIIFLCAKKHPKILSIWFWVHKTFSFMANFLSKSKLPLGLFVWAKIWLTDNCWC